MVESADVVVVGARCAGASTAMLFARAGRRVILLERGRPGTDTVSTLYIQPPAMGLLKRWGLLGRVEDTGAPALPTATYCIDGARVSGRPRWPSGVPAARAPRRRELDTLLVDAAAEAGVDVRVRCSAVGPTWDDERVTGIRYLSLIHI